MARQEDSKQLQTAGFVNSTKNYYQFFPWDVNLLYTLTLSSITWNNGFLPRLFRTVIGSYNIMNHDHLTCVDSTCTASMGDWSHQAVSTIILTSRCCQTLWLSHILATKVCDRLSLSSEMRPRVCRYCRLHICVSEYIFYHLIKQLRLTYNNGFLPSHAANLLSSTLTDYVTQ